MKAKPRYATEAALCADFIAWVKRDNGQHRYGEKLDCRIPIGVTLRDIADYGIFQTEAA